MVTMPPIYGEIGDGLLCFTHINGGTIGESSAIGPESMDFE